MISGRSVEGCEMVRYEGSLRCDKARGVGSAKKMQRCKGAKTERSETTRQEELKSEFWGKTSLFFGVDTKGLNTNDK